jgi:cytochrome P450
MLAAYITPMEREETIPGDNTDQPALLPVRVTLLREQVSLIRSWKVMRDNVLGIIPDAATHEKVLSGRTGKRWHMVMDPQAIRRILLDRLDDYPKSIVTKNLLRPAIGDSLFIAEGAHWRWQRRSAAPAFSHRNVTALAPVMSAAAERSLERVSQAGSRAINMFDEMVAATFDVIADVTFSGDGSFDRGAVHRAIEAYISEAGKVSLLDVLGAPDWVPRPGRAISARTMEQMRADADAAIRARASTEPRIPPDLLDLLLAGQDPKSKRRMNADELRDNLLTFIVAGHETTAVTLAWSFYLCAFDPAVQTRAHDEARAVLNGRVATGADIEKLSFCRQIIDESLRLYPPGGIISRTAQRPDQLCGADIRPGDTVMIPIYALGRHRLLWDNPDQFQPERFADPKTIDRYAYLPFGAGPRICIGASFAVQEAVIILATLLSRFRFTPVKGRNPDPVMILTLRPQGGVWLQATPL